LYRRRIAISAILQQMERLCEAYLHLANLDVSDATASTSKENKLALIRDLTGLCFMSVLQYAHFRVFLD
jgi:hypothetical protein